MSSNRDRRSKRGSEHAPDASHREARRSREQIITSLQERAKELTCLYEVEGVLSRADAPLDDVLRGVAAAVSAGWQYPEACRTAILLGTEEFRATDFQPSQWLLEAEIRVQDDSAGWIRVYYVEAKPEADDGPFLQDEVRLIRTIAQRIGHFLLIRRLAEFQQDVRRAQAGARDPDAQWRGPLRLIRDADTALYVRFARRMLNNLASMGVAEAQAMLQDSDAVEHAGGWLAQESNIPGRRRAPDTALLLTDHPFELAAVHMSDTEILARLQQWMHEDKASNFLKIVDNPRSTLQDFADAIRRYYDLVKGGQGLSFAKRSSVNVTLIRRYLTENLDYIKVAKEFVGLDELKLLLERTVLPADSKGRLGGKGAGLLLAQRILAAHDDPARPVGEIKVPRTWYVASDGMLDFIGHNDLEDVMEQKYKSIEQIRQEYPNIVQLFKNSQFPPAILQGLSVALDDLGDVPLIVRSSSLLEDRLGTAFSGKYKSLFLANQGTKPERMEALCDAIAEVYSSVFSPDPIQYRSDRGLLDFSEEMGILIQEVVGTRVGRWFFPAFAGVALSRNEFRWSPRIKREDGLVRLVPGLGTRAVDRVPDDYPVLAAPGRPDLRVNVATDEIARYAPKKLDVINLERNTLESVDVREVLREAGDAYPALENIFSKIEGDRLRKPVKLLLDPAKDDLVVTFAGLFENTPLLSNIANMLGILEATIGAPVDLEFAHDGRDFYLLQCRPQSQVDEDGPAAIPKDVASEHVLFSASKYVSNGWVPDVSHVVYVDPESYASLANRADLLAVGRAVGALNKLLPKRQFILMGPGRWGSRGDVKLGVNVTYSDISNAAMLVEIARQKGGYLPDLSFGTHFFQDLVESRIRYLPLYPDEEGNEFNQLFLDRARNLLPEILPAYRELADTVRVIDVAAETENRVLRILMNAELDEALAVFADPTEERGQPVARAGSDRQPNRDAYWRWRLRAAERIGAEMDAERFGVVALYVFGSTKNASAGPGSDIDLLVHFRGDDGQRALLLTWLDGWSRSLAELNYWSTGYRADGLLDVHVIGDDDIARRSSYAVKIGAVTDPARKLVLGGGARREA